MALVSFLWLVIRSGTKPSRINYPCQKQARNNVILFGLPAMGFFLHRLSRSARFRRKAGLMGLMVVVLTISAGQLWRVVKTEMDRKPISAQSTASKVVWVMDDKATLNRNYTMTWNNKADQTAIDAMADRAILALTGQTSVAAGWTKLFQDRNEKNGKGRRDWQSGEKIAIKINNNNAGCEDDNGHCPLTQSILTVLRQLVTVKGIPEANITVYDVSRGLFDYQTAAIQGRFPNVVIGQLKNCSSQKVNNVSAYIAADLAEATYLINMPLLRTHQMAGASLSLKNHLGSTCSPENFHGTFFNTTNNGLVYLNSNSNIKDKTVLVWDDAIYGLKTNGPYGYPDGAEGIRNPYPNAFFLSVDPVAIDSVMVDYLQSLRGTEWWNPDTPRTALQAAANAGLGNYATSCEGTNCSFSYTNISLVRCSPNCSGSNSIPTLVQDQCPKKPQGDANCDNVVDVIDYSVWYKEFIEGDRGQIEKTSWKADFTGINGIKDDKVDIYDFSAWYKGRIGA